jgi:hypothetical protein
MKEVMFEILAEGGSTTIERHRTEAGNKFISHHYVMDLLDEGIEENKQFEYPNFEEAFQEVNTFAWFQLYLSTVHADYRDYVVAELMKALNEQGVRTEELYSKSQLEIALAITLEFDNFSESAGWTYKDTV